MNIVSFGGGTNSAAMIIGMYLREIPVDLILFADTGRERRHTYDFIEKFDAWLTARGLPEVTLFFCPSMKKTEIIDLYENERDLFDRALAIERGAAATLTSVKGLGRKWSWESLIDAYEEEKALDAAQISLFDFIETSGGCICGAPCGCYDG